MRDYITRLGLDLTEKKDHIKRQGLSLAERVLELAEGALYKVRLFEETAQRIHDQKCRTTDPTEFYTLYAASEVCREYEFK